MKLRNYKHFFSSSQEKLWSKSFVDHSMEITSFSGLFKFWVFVDISQPKVKAKKYFSRIMFILKETMIDVELFSGNQILTWGVQPLIFFLQSLFDISIARSTQWKAVEKITIK